MSVVEPLVIYDAGFQLTVLATFGLPLLVPPIQRALAAPFRALPGAVVVAELLAVTIAAQLATLPVLAVTFHQVSLIAPIANLLTVPLLAPLLIVGATLAVLGLTTVLGQPILLGATLALGWIAWPLLWYVDRAIELCAALPFAAITVSDVPALAIFAYYTALALTVWGIPSLIRRLRQRAQSDVSAVEPADGIMQQIPHKAGHVRLGVQADGIARARRCPGLGGRSFTSIGERRDGAARFSGCRPQWRGDAAATALRRHSSHQRRARWHGSIRRTRQPSILLPTLARPACA